MDTDPSYNSCYTLSFCGISQFRFPKTFADSTIPAELADHQLAVKRKN
jgi:hypothetical protein